MRAHIFVSPFKTGQERNRFSMCHEDGAIVAYLMTRQQNNFACFDHPIES